MYSEWIFLASGDWIMKKNMFIWGVVVVAFQSVFHSEMHQNNIFFIFLKIIFDISISK
jgi:hypothetical protein